MCEFEVFKKLGDREDKVADEVIGFSFENGRLVLRNILGSRKAVDDCIVCGLNVTLERMDLLEVQGLGKFLNFLDALSRAYTSGEYSRNLEDAWKDVSSFWEEQLRQFQRSSGERKLQ